MKTVEHHYIGGEFVESHGSEVMESVNPSNGEVLGHVTLGDAEDARRAIAAATKAFPAYARTTKEERSRYLRRLHEAVAARAGDLTAVIDSRLALQDAADAHRRLESGEAFGKILLETTEARSKDVSRNA